MKDKNAKQVVDCQHHEGQKYKNDDPLQYLLYDVMECTRTMELFENGEKDKNSCHSYLLKNGVYEIRSIVEFSHNNLPSTCYIFEDLITTTNFQLSKIFCCGIKSRKCVKVERKKCFASLISLISNNFKPKMKKVLKFDQRASFLQNLIENVRLCGKLLSPHFDINDLYLIVFKPPENSNKLEEMEE